jgi:hypothetical protein
MLHADHTVLYANHAPSQRWLDTPRSQVAPNIKQQGQPPKHPILGELELHPSLSLILVLR